VEVVLDLPSSLPILGRSFISLVLLLHMHVLIYRAVRLTMMLKLPFGTKTLMDTKQISNGQSSPALMEPTTSQVRLILTSFFINMVLIMTMVAEFLFGTKIPMDTKETCKLLLKTEVETGGLSDSFTQKNAFMFKALFLTMQLRLPNGTMLNKATLNGNSLLLKVAVVVVATSKITKTRKHWLAKDEDVTLSVLSLLMPLHIYKVVVLTMMLKSLFGIRTHMDTNRIFNGLLSQVLMEPFILQALLILTSCSINLVLIIIMVEKFLFGTRILMDTKEIFKFDLRNAVVVTG